MAKNKKEISPVLEEQKDTEVKEPKYSDEEKDYLAGLRLRMEQARDDREAGHEEFDGKTYTEWYESNERGANTYIRPKQNKQDTNFVSGTIRQKMFQLLASINNLNLQGDVMAYDRDDFPLEKLGNGMEEIISKTREIENDDEKRLLRQYELLKHGTIFTEEVWKVSEEVEKKMRVAFSGKLNSAKWTTRIKEAMEMPERNLLSGLNVFLGDIRQYDIRKQPFIFTVDVKNYAEAKTIYGSWERWDFVPKTVRNFVPATTTSSTIANTGYGGDWRLTNSGARNDYCEIIKYQDPWSNEFAVIINGVLMTPVGLPLPWAWNGYNIAQQNLEPIAHNFSYGRSFVSRLRTNTAILDEMLRLAVLKTQKSFLPPKLNLSDKIVSNRIAMPAAMTRGIGKGEIVNLDDNDALGVTASEFNMISELQRNLDQNSISQTFGGQAEQGDKTATEISTLQRQAEVMMGLTVFCMSLLEQKLDYLRLYNLLQNWFEATSETNILGEVRKRFRRVARPANIGGQGRGMRMVEPVTSGEMPTPEQAAIISKLEGMSRGFPVEKIFLNVDELKQAKLTWRITVTPKLKKSTDTAKLMYRRMLGDIAIFQQDWNIDYLEQRAAEVWEEDSDKLFTRGMNRQQMMAGGQGEAVPPDNTKLNVGGGAKANMSNTTV